MPEYFNVLNVNVADTNLIKASATIEDWIANDARTYVCIAPVATIMDCQDSEEYRAIVNNAGMATPDGMPLVWIGKLQGKKELGRTYGPDLMNALCALSQSKGYRHYFYGGTPETNTKLINNLQKRFPKLMIAGYFAPPFRKVKEKEGVGIIDEINKAKPDIFWVGLGSPKQDYWMHQHRDQLNVPVMVGVGAAFDFIAGVKQQAPRWIQRSGLEWLFRLCSEPKRLWRRYLIGNSRFIYLLIKDKLKI